MNKSPMTLLSLFLLTLTPSLFSIDKYYYDSPQEVGMGIQQEYNNFVKGFLWEEYNSGLSNAEKNEFLDFAFKDALQQCSAGGKSAKRCVQGAFQERLYQRLCKLIDSSCKDFAAIKRYPQNCAQQAASRLKMELARHIGELNGLGSFLEGKEGMFEKIEQTVEQVYSFNSAPTQKAPSPSPKNVRCMSCETTMSKTYKLPMCSHYLCESCLRVFINSARMNGGTVTCPQCSSSYKTATLEQLLPQGASCSKCMSKVETVRLPMCNHEICAVCLQVAIKNRMGDNVYCTCGNKYDYATAVKYLRK